MSSEIRTYGGRGGRSDRKQLKQEKNVIAVHGLNVQSQLPPTTAPQRINGLKKKENPNATEKPSPKRKKTPRYPGWERKDDSPGGTDGKDCSGSAESARQRSPPKGKKELKTTHRKQSTARNHGPKRKEMSTQADGKKSCLEQEKQQKKGQGGIATATRRTRSSPIDRAKDSGLSELGGER